jgi:hypothetical protein
MVSQEIEIFSISGENQTVMQNNILAGFYERDLRKLIDEIKLFENEEKLWKVTGDVKNPAGNLALHIIGGSNHLFGKILAKTDYVRNRPEEFSKKGVPRATIVAQLEELISLVTTTVKRVDMNADYPIPFDDATRTNEYVMVQLLAHLNYHLGQVNYLRRILE